MEGQSVEALRELYEDTVQKLGISVNGSNPVDVTRKRNEKLIDCLYKIQNISFQTRQLQLFSKNEELSDIKTGDLCFVGCFFYISQIYSSLQYIQDDDEKTEGLQDKFVIFKISNLKRAMTFIQGFLRKCEELGAVDKEDKKFLDKLWEVLENDSEENGVKDLKEELARKSPEDVREYKVSSFIKSREISSKISQFLENKHEEDEEIQREFELLRIQDLIVRGINDFMFISTELHLLSSRQTVLTNGVEDLNLEELQEEPKKSGLKFISVNGDKASFNVVNNGQTSQVDGQNDAEFMKMTAGLKGLGALIQSAKSREQIKQEIFRPSWAQPTMSLEEFAEIEQARMLAEEERRKEQQLEKGNDDIKMDQVQAEGLEDDEDTYDKATENERRWDDWKDDNTKGSGVTKRY